jgi:hypothetical protein
LFSYFETVFPLQKDRKLIGTREWEFKLGAGAVRGFRWGTVTVRAAAEYDGEENKIAPGEYAIEYLRRISPSIRVFLGVEGSEDEIELIPVLRWFVRPNVSFHLNSAVGLTSKATDWAPEIGLMFSFPVSNGVRRVSCSRPSETQRTRNGRERNARDRLSSRFQGHGAWLRRLFIPAP